MGPGREERGLEAVNLREPRKQGFLAKENTPPINSPTSLQAGGTRICPYSKGGANEPNVDD